jgi:hypothetical protein
MVMSNENERVSSAPNLSQLLVEDVKFVFGSTLPRMLCFQFTNCKPEITMSDNTLASSHCGM